MKSLSTLLKLAKRNLDVLQRMLADQFARLTDLDQRMTAHEQTIKAEQQVALRDYDGARAYGGFAGAAIARRAALAGEADLIQLEIARLREIIAEAHVEVRKFERLIELEKQRAKKAAAKREDAELDEIAVLRAGRNIK